MRVALVTALALAAAAVGVTLSGSPSEVSATNGVKLEARLGQTKGAEICQPDESLLPDTSAVRLGLEAVIGPRVAVEVFSGTHLLTSGTRGSVWTAASVTVPVRALAHAAANVTLCFAVSPTRVHVAMLGTRTRRARAAYLVGGRALPGRIGVEYMRAGHRSWFSLALSVARRMGLGHALAGTWIAVPVLALMLALAVLVSWLALRELGGGRQAVGAIARSRVPRILRRVPAAAWTCAVVACVNAACWSVITPPFEVPDEPNHFAYVQVLSSGQLPSSSAGEMSPALRLALHDLGADEVRYAPQHPSIASAAQQRKLEGDMSAPISREGPGGAGSASDEPPLYYGLELLPFELGSGGSLLAQLELMRLLSALMAAATALFAYLFLREALPGTRWAWTVGGLAVALFPLLGFISGGVNPDAMLFAVCTALYYCLARAFHRGLTPRLAVAIGLLTAIGFVTKLNFVGFAPGVLLGLVVLSVRGARRRAREPQAERRAVYRPLAIALLIATAPVLLYGLVNLLSGHSVLGSASATLKATSGSLGHELGYVWQFYLPRLPGMSNYFPGVFTTRQLWFDGLVGMYGWADTLFPGWAYDIALIPAGLIAVLGLRELVRRRAALRRRIPELVVYGVTAAGVLALVGVQSYASDVIDGFEPFWEPRYLLPMVALWGFAAALAARGAGRRWGPAVGAGLIVLFLAHDVFSQLQVIARYYS